MTPPAMAATADAVPAEKITEKSEPIAGEAPILDHAYDGIQEYDNPLPGWWRASFWASIVFAAGYWVWFHVVDWGSSPEATYRSALASYEEGRATREEAEIRDISEEVLARNARDPALVARGQAVFAAKCASCHAEDGRGLIGPNLTDRYQLHGTTRMDMYKTVRSGVVGTAMLAWGEQMPATDVVAVTTFAATLRGQNVKGKEPQGQPVEPFK